MAKEIILPEGWKVDKIENGKIILKESESKYPKTWEECWNQLEEGEFIDDNCHICGVDYYGEPLNEHDRNILPVGYGRKILALSQLLICRNAYWGDWRPNWKTSAIKYTIRTNEGKVFLDYGKFYGQTLAFPDHEMRNVFYENFKDLIEEAKDLL